MKLKHRQLRGIIILTVLLALGLTAAIVFKPSPTSVNIEAEPVDTNIILIDTAKVPTPTEPVVRPQRRQKARPSQKAPAPRSRSPLDEEC